MAPSPYALILDDHPLVAQGVAEFLRVRLPSLEVVVASQAEAARDVLATRGAPSLALVDLWMAHDTTLDLVTDLRARFPATPVAVMSGDDDPAVAAQVRAAGAHAFIHKHEPPEVVAQAVEALLGGLTWFRPPVHPAAPIRPREIPVTPSDLGLSVRQGEILSLVLQGLPNKRIAQRFGLSESTVKEHMTAILQRLGARTRVEVITQLRGRRLTLPDASAP